MFISYRVPYIIKLLTPEKFPMERKREKRHSISYSVARGLNFKFCRTYFFWHKLYSFDASKVSFTPLKLPFGLASLGVLSLEGRDVITGHLQY